MNDICAGGITSEWFTLESSLLTLCMTAAALSFVNDRTAKSARRMFHASLLYLPVFMSGLLLHRLPNCHNESTLAAAEEEQLISVTRERLGDESRISQSRGMRDLTCSQVRPPVAFASVAPFPFLPAPLYVAPDSWAIPATISRFQLYVTSMMLCLPFFTYVALEKLAIFIPLIFDVIKPNLLLWPFCLGPKCLIRWKQVPKQTMGVLVTFRFYYFFVEYWQDLEQSWLLLLDLLWRKRLIEEINHLVSVSNRSNEIFSSITFISIIINYSGSLYFLLPFYINSTITFI